MPNMIPSLSDRNFYPLKIWKTPSINRELCLLISICGDFGCDYCVECHTFKNHLVAMKNGWDGNI